ncbi:hypothetical protein QD47_29240 [Paenibacillus terrae]|uniref:Uncharacterized protein n=2 Tax=Paenibacillus terrae TaxID=159743 RepID=A0A0D7WSW9_9BACL|nr:hypothetical protein QD47_29240 [Paenibacillus terrae]
MGTQLSFTFQNESLLITGQKNAETSVMDNPIDPFVEANKKFFVDYTGVQLSLDFTKPKEEECMNIKDVSEKLGINNKYTLLIFDDLTGFPVATQLTMLKVLSAPAAQYKEALHLTFRVKRHRRATEIIFFPNKTFIIWEGHIHIDTNMWGKASITTNGVIRKRSKYGKNDECFLIKDGMESTEKEPIIVYRPVGPIF